MLLIIKIPIFITSTINTLIKISNFIKKRVNTDFVQVFKNIKLAS